MIDSPYPDISLVVSKQSNDEPFWWFGVGKIGSEVIMIPVINIQVATRASDPDFSAGVYGDTIE
jgi:hypothetical protein